VISNNRKAFRSYCRNCIEGINIRLWPSVVHLKAESRNNIVYYMHVCACAYKWGIEPFRWTQSSNEKQIERKSTAHSLMTIEYTSVSLWFNCLYNILNRREQSNNKLLTVALNVTLFRQYLVIIYCFNYNIV